MRKRSPRARPPKSNGQHTPPPRAGDPIEVSLSSDAGDCLASSGIVTAALTLIPGWWTVQAKSLVGVAQVAGIELWIKPKVDIARIVFMLGYAGDPKGWGDEDVGLEQQQELMPALAHAFERQADRALQQGLLQGYKRIEDSLPVLRGRLREAEQLKRRFGLPMPLEVAFDDFTIDIPENQLLLSAARRLLRLPRVPVEVRRRLVRLASRMFDVTELVGGQQLPRWTPSRLNVRYQIAIRLAEMVLRATSAEQLPGSVRVNGFLFDMAEIFEDFVTVAMTESLARYEGRSHREPLYFLDAAGGIKMKPDLVWYSEGQAAAVIDAKYKAEKLSKFPNADLYQMLAYCTALGLERGPPRLRAGKRGRRHPHRVQRGGGDRATCPRPFAASPAAPGAGRRHHATGGRELGGSCRVRARGSGVVAGPFPEERAMCPLPL